MIAADEEQNGKEPYHRVVMRAGERIDSVQRPRKNRVISVAKRFLGRRSAEDSPRESTPYSAE